MTILLIIMVVKDMTYSLVPLVRATPHLRIISALSLHYPCTIPALSPHRHRISAACTAVGPLPSRAARTVRHRRVHPPPPPPPPPRRAS